MATGEVSTLQRGRQFTREEASRGGHATKIARQERQNEMAARRAFVDAMVARWETGEIGPNALALANEMISTALSGLESVRIESTLDLERVVRAADVLFKMHRLASGQSTSNTAHATIGDDERATRVAELRARTDALDAQ